MVKVVKSLKSDNERLRLEALLPSLLGRVPFIKITRISNEPLTPRASHHAHQVAEVIAGDQNWTLVAEKKRLGHPSEVRTAVLQLQHSLRQLPKGSAGYGVVLAPFISEESAKICTEAGVGYADLSGNARLSFDQVFIETRGSDNPLREKRETRPLFTLRGTRVLRLLLQGPLRPWKVKDLAEKAGVSLGGVSTVRQQLLAHEWAVEEKEGFRVTKPGALLDAWAKADDWEKRTEVRNYSVLVTDAEDLAKRLHSLLGETSHAFTQWFGAGLRHPLASVPLVTAYVKKFPDELILSEKLLARRIDGVGRARLVVPKDEGVLHLLQTLNQLPVVCDVQLYLDLIHAGLRGDEAAEELRSWPDFSGGWA